MATMQTPAAGGPSEKPKGVGSKLKSMFNGLASKLQGEEELPSAPTHRLPAPSRPPQAVQAPFSLPTVEVPSSVAGGASGVSSPGATSPGTPTLATLPMRAPAAAATPAPTTLGVRPGRIGEAGEYAGVAEAPTAVVAAGPGVIWGPAGAIPVPEPQTLGVRPGRIGEGAVEGAAGEAMRVPSPIQGERVKVQRRGGAAKAGGVPELAARPELETKAASAEEIAALKEREHEMRLAEERRHALAKQQEMVALKRQAEMLEMESYNLLAEASQDKMKVDRHLAKKATIEQREWSNYAQAEAAERQRREVVREAAPLAQTAEQREAQALRVRRLAEDTNYHAQVLESKAKALLLESTEMAELARARMLAGEQLAAEQMLAQQEVEEVRMRLKEINSGDLPTYIEECLAEIGRLSHRIGELRGEIEWAKHQMEATHYQGITWERLVMAKQAIAGQLMLRVSQARREAELASERSKQAAEEAKEPTALAEVKYEEGYRLSQQAEEVEREARGLQEEALGIVAQAQQPELLRQEKLREAGEAEVAAKVVGAQVELETGRLEARLHEAEVKAETAAQLAQQAQVVESEVERTQRVVAQEAQMAESYGVQRERHAAAPSLLAVAT